MRSLPALLLLLIALACVPARADAVTEENREFARAMALYRSRRFDRSAVIFAALARAHPGKAMYLLDLGNSLYELKRYEDAAGAYRRVIATGSPLRVPARLFLSYCLRDQGRSDEALIVLRDNDREAMPPGLRAQMEQQKARLLESAAQSLADSGLLDYRNRDYESALRKFELSERLYPSADVSMMRGLTLLHLYRPEEARAAFVRTTQLGPRPDIAAEAADFLREIREGLWRTESPFGAAADVSMGYNSNLFGSGVTNPTYAEPVAETDLSASYQFGVGRPLSARLEDDFTWDEIFNLPDYRLFSNTLQLRGIDTSGDWMFQATPYTQSQWLGGAPFSTRIGGQLRAEHDAGNRQLGLALNLDHIFAGAAQFAYVAGTFAQARAYWGRAIGDHDLLLSLYFWREDIGNLPVTGGTIPLGNDSFGPAFDWTWYFLRLWSLRTTISYFHRDYLQPESPDGSTRIDNQINFAARLGYLIKPGLSLYLLPGYTVNTSTLNATDSVMDMNYTQLVVRAGISWELSP